MLDLSVYSKDERKAYLSRQSTYLFDDMMALTTSADFYVSKGDTEKVKKLAEMIVVQKATMKEFFRLHNDEIIEIFGEDPRVTKFLNE